LLFHQVAAAKGNEKMGEWSDGIVNHFWYCCSAASEYDDQVKDTAVLKVKLFTRKWGTPGLYTV